MSAEAQPLTPAMVELMRQLLDAPLDAAGVRVTPQRQRTLRALERRGFATDATLTMAGATALAAHERIFGKAA